MTTPANLDLTKFWEWETSQPKDDCAFEMGHAAQPQVSFSREWGFYTDNDGYFRPFRFVRRAAGKTGIDTAVEYTADAETDALVLVADRRSYEERAADEDEFEALLAGTPRTASVGDEFAKPSVPGKLFDYILEEKTKYDGWFPRGRCHIIAGSSGTGKTRLMLNLLDAQSRCEYFLGHRGAGAEFIVVFADRGQLSNQETLISMGLEHLSDRIKHIPVCWGAQAADAIKTLVEAEQVTPAVVFVEGADMLVDNPNAMESVAPFMSKLNALAHHYHMAIVLSLGSGKAKAGEGYQQARDRVFGSVAYSRMADTVTVLNTVNADEDDDERVLTVKHRSAKHEKFHLRFIDGRLIEKPEQAEELHPVDEWFSRHPNDEFTRGEVVDGLKEAEAPVKQSAVYDRITKLLSEGRLARRTREDGKHMLRWVKPA